MLYIRKFYVVQKIYIFISISIHRWDTGTQLQWQVTNMACNGLRARGACGRDAPQAPPPPNSYISIYIKISCLCVCRVTSGVSTDVIVRIDLYASWNCLSTDVMFVNWWNYRPGTNDDRDTAYREYKWRPGTSKRNYRLGHWDTGNINDDRDTVTQLQRGRRGYREDI